MKASEVEKMRAHSINMREVEETYVKECSIERDIFVQGGIKVATVDEGEIKVYQKVYDKIFLGKISIEIFSYVLYSVGNNLKWMIEFMPLSYKIPSNIKICFSSVNDKNSEYVAEIENAHYRMDKETRKSCYYSIILLPEKFVNKELSIEFKQFNDYEVSGNIVDNAGIHKEINELKIKEFYCQEFCELRQLLMHYKRINIENEVNYLKRRPDLLPIIIECLKEIEIQREFFVKHQGTNEIITCIIPATYDKKFYCASKLADNALQVKANEMCSIYEVTFSGKQISELELMSYLFFDNSNNQDVENRKYLTENSFIYCALNTIHKYVHQISESGGSSGSGIRSVLSRLIQYYNKELQNRVDDVFNQISREGRIQTRWGKEYQLFMIVNKLVPYAYYQYRCDWLGQQSYDIYLGKDKIAIEYQGQQHYEPISVFGGLEGLKATQARDEKKRKLSKEHGITMLEWKYSKSITEENVINFLKDNGVNVETTSFENTENNIIMSPIKEKKERVKKEVTQKKENKYLIYQYNLDGEFIAEYSTTLEIGEKYKTGEYNIRRACSGFRSSAAGYQWRKVPVGTSHANIEPIIKQQNTGVKRTIDQYSLDGEFIKRYESVSLASNENSINSKSIRDAANNKQKHAGGFIWKYVEEENR